MQTLSQLSYGPLSAAQSIRSKSAPLRSRSWGKPCFPHEPLLLLPLLALTADDTYTPRAATMFELGASLRDARRKRGLELDAVQRATRIRRRYLEAMEDERFDLLPGVAYSRGFLREYAEFLGLDGSLYVQEYNDRFAPREETLPIAPRRSASRPVRVQPASLLVPAVLLALALAIGLAAWKLTGRGTHPAAATTPPATTTTAPPAKPKPKRAAAPAIAEKPSALVVTAARGDSWVMVRLGSASGPVLWEKMLHRGSTLRFGLRRPLWMRVGAGLNLDAHVGARPVALPHVVGNVVVRASS